MVTGTNVVIPYDWKSQMLYHMTEKAKCYWTKFLDSSKDVMIIAYQNLAQNIHPHHGHPSLKNSFICHITNYIVVEKTMWMEQG